MGNCLYGGWTQTRFVDHVQMYCDQVKEEFLRKSGVNATKYEAIAYRSQVGSGINYLVKVWYAEVQDGYAHLLIYEPLSKTNEDLNLVKFQVQKTSQDPLIPW